MIAKKQDDIKVGMYVRNIYGNVGVITEKYDIGVAYNSIYVSYVCITKGYSIMQFRHEIEILSPNIEDVIKVGDYVNGREVCYIQESPKLIFIDDDSIKNSEIKNIITREYIIGGVFEV